MRSSMALDVISLIHTDIFNVAEAPSSHLI
nr:MAG TPA: hypothetical protein [Caudoviricetes sp.]